MTDHGTLVVLGKPRDNGRYIRMKRIHTPKLNTDGYRGVVVQNLKIRERPRLNNYVDSPLRGLAINPHGSEDELATAERIITQVEATTKKHLERMQNAGLRRAR